ncbi:MAG: hypothetical protein U9R25_20695 [Chloroflexota bacterium]|nr:hypothetical protein [Chloroflexota bacterium]
MPISHAVWVRLAKDPAWLGAFSQALADEVKEPGIQINVLSPGPIRTQMMADPSYQTDRTRWMHILELENVAVAVL